MRRILMACLVALAPACGGSPTQPTVTSLTIDSASPPGGSTVVVPPQFTFFQPGGVPIPPGSGLLSVDITITVSHDVPWAQLNVYMLTDGPSGYCGQNVNDAPTWQFITPGWKTKVAVSGFRLYQLPCDVTGYRAMLHMRNNGNLTPPLPSETIAEATMALKVRFQR